MKDQIKSYLQRLNHGEALENVQADFVRECKDVDPAEIMHAEQELLREGTSIKNCSGSVMCIPPCSMVPRQMPRNCTLRTYRTNGSPLLPP